MHLCTHGPNHGPNHNFSNWTADVLKYSQIDNGVASAVLFDLLNQGFELEGLELVSWPLIVEWQSKQIKV